MVTETETEQQGTQDPVAEQLKARERQLQALANPEDPEHFVYLLDQILAETAALASYATDTENMNPEGVRSRCKVLRGQYDKMIYWTNVQD